MKDEEVAKAEAIAFHRVVAASGHYKPVFHPRKKTKAMQDMLHGKRNLDMAVARGLSPPHAYMYETTDGRRVRVFYGRRRKSKSAMMSVGRSAAVLFCLRWAWSTYQKEQSELGNRDAEQTPDRSKVKID